MMDFFFSKNYPTAMRQIEKEIHKAFSHETRKYLNFKVYTHDHTSKYVYIYIAIHIYVYFRYAEDTPNG